MNQDIIERKLLVAADPARVWQALTDPQQTPSFMFNCVVSSDWTPGSRISWKGNYMGYDRAERGIILECTPGVQLKYTSFDPNFGLEDKAENYLHISYTLVPAGTGTELITVIENFNGDSRRTGHIAGGWDNVVLPALERLLQ